MEWYKSMPYLYDYWASCIFCLVAGVFTGYAVAVLNYYIKHKREIK